MIQQTDDRPERHAFDIGGHHVVDVTSPQAQATLAAAHADRVRPLCRCTQGGVPMYIARVGTDRYLIKRMPDTGMLHAPGCASYQPPESLSGLGQVLGGAILEEPKSGCTALRLGFRMSRADRNAPANPGTGGSQSDSVVADGSRLSMRAVLDYLWQEADLATWSQGMAGKRNWRVVSWHLRLAARGKFTKGKPLLTRLFVPEPFTADRKAELAARRISAWAPARQPGRSHRFMMLIGELKAIEEARFGHKLLIKHLPDAPLMLDDDLHRRFQKRFSDELELWQIDEQGHLMVIATFTVGPGGLATVEELSVAMTDQHWLPYESQADKLLLEVAIEQRRRFTKSLRYNLGPDQPMASLVFTDTATPTAAYLLRSDEDRAAADELADETGTDTWVWVISEDLPELPPPEH